MKYPPSLRPAGEESHPQTAPERALNIYRVWIVAIVIMAIITGVVMASDLHRNPSPNGGGSSSSWRATAADAATPSWFAALQFNCLGGADLGVGPAPPPAYVNALRAGTHPEYDRVTIQFAGGRPVETGISTQTSARFTAGPGGKAVTLKGQAGALVTLHFTDGHTRYTGPTDITTGYRVVLELRKIQDSGGTLQWAIGLAPVPCYRMAYWDNPTRLVIDFASHPPS